MKKLIYDFYAHFVFSFVFLVAENALDASAVLSSGIAQKKATQQLLSEVLCYVQKRAGEIV